jgi:N-acetyl sugar amidotransferase
MKFCSQCLYSENHPFGITFNDKGLCSGCIIHKEKNNLDWDNRFEKLKKIIKTYKIFNKNNYDCIVPVSGGGDSYFIVHIVKNILGMNPLLVTNNKYFNTNLGIYNLSNLRIKFNCDILTQNINPISVKKITRHTLADIGNIYWPVIAGQTVFPVQTAVKYKIPLIFWGAHQGTEQTGMFSYTAEVEMSRRYRKEHDLMGLEADDLMQFSGILKEEDIWQYRYPADNEINAVGVRGIYLGNYLSWDSKRQNEKMIKLYNYRTAALNRTFNTYEHIECFNYINIHDLLKFYKHGYSRVTDHAVTEIRFNRMSRQQALENVKKFEKQTIKYLDLFCEWIGIDKGSLKILMDRFRNKKIFKQKKINIWSNRGLSFFIDNKNNKYFTRKKFISFICTDKNNLDKHKKYITIGKGFSEKK